VARQRQRQVGVAAVVDVGQLQVGLEDGGFEGHGERARFGQLQR